MNRIRVIPTLLLGDGGLVKTRKFKNPVYVGDPINTLRIFNEKEVDEIALFDVSEHRFTKPLDLGFISEIVSEAFMPVAYGGGVCDLPRMEALLKAGIEKVVVNSAIRSGADLFREAARQFGVQSIVGSLDVRKTIFSGPQLFTYSGKHRMAGKVADWAKRLEDWGCGELILNSIDRECTYHGYELALIKEISNAVDVPVIASGGAGSIGDFKAAREAGASAVAAGAMFVFQRPNQAVLITYPSREALQNLL
jgi:cyclase